MRDYMWTRMTFNSKFGELRACHASLEEGIRALQADFNAEAHNLDPEAAGQEDEHLHFSVPNRLRGSLLVTAFALFESSLSDLLHSGGNAVGQSLRVNDLQGSLFERTKTYWKKVIGHEQSLPAVLGGGWQPLLRLYKLRNIEAHQGGHVDATSKDGQVANSTPGVSVEFGSLAYEDTFLPAALNGLEGCLEVMLSALPPEPPEPPIEEQVELLRKALEEAKVKQQG